MPQAPRSSRCATIGGDPDPERDAIYKDFYLPAVGALDEAGLPFLVGGAYAFERLTGIERDLKDFDIFVRPEDCQRVLDKLAAIGYQTELTFSHWLGKAVCGKHYIDVIFNSGNGIARVDEDWFKYAIIEDFFGISIKLCPIEETIWSKAFVMERERYDGADVAHLLLAYDRLDWPRLLQRFGPHWQLLLSHIILFGFAYPSERSRIPKWVIDDLLQKFRQDLDSPSSSERICQGTLLSREQYLLDVEHGGYEDARLAPRGNMTKAETDQWTAAIGKGK
jgi:hypothetical protein